MFYVELHTHTYPASSDSKVSPRLLMDCCKAKGLNGVVISNHYDHAQLDKFKSGIIEWLNDVNRAKEIAKRLDMYAYCGLEYSTSDGYHIALLGGTTTLYEYGAPEPECSLNYILRYAQLNGLLPVWNHPIRHTGVSDIWISSEFAYESYSMKYKHRDVNAYMTSVLVDMAPPSKYITVAGSDVHSIDDIGRGVLAFEECIPNEVALIEAIRNREYGIVLNEENDIITECNVLKFD